MEIILGKMGELVLKGLNRKKFEDRLISSLRHRLSQVGNYDVYAMQSVVFIEPREPSCDLDQALEIAQKTFGLISVSRSYAVEKDMDKILEAVAEKFGPLLRSARSFKVEARRADKTFPLRSPEIAQRVGGALHDRYPHLLVEMHAPERTIFVEVRELAAYVHADPLPGAGGLPSGISGKAAILLSGGIDSPVAAYMMAKRGFALEAVHFHSYPYTSERARGKVLDLANKLSEYCGRIALYVVPFTMIQERIRDRCPEQLTTIVMRRSMMRIAERIARESGCSALITGENLGQVASQTIEALAVTGETVELPILRPVIGLDKNEIVRIARNIDTFETSIQPYEDCCTVFTPKHPETKPKLAHVRLAEEKCDLCALESGAVDTFERLVIHP